MRPKIRPGGGQQCRKHLSISPQRGPPGPSAFEEAIDDQANQRKCHHRKNRGQPCSSLATTTSKSRAVLGSSMATQVSSPRPRSSWTLTSMKLRTRSGEPRQQAAGRPPVLDRQRVCAEHPADPVQPDRCGARRHTRGAPRQSPGPADRGV